MNQEKIIYLKIDDFKNNESLILNSISNERKEKALKYLQNEDRIRSFLGSYLLKKYIKSEIKYSSLNKPYCDDCYFSLSHCDSYVLLYISDNECGIDIEKDREVSNKVIDYCLDEKEKKLLNDNENFIYFWTRKEAFSKCLGQGMFNGLKIKDIPSNQDSFIYTGERYSLYTFKKDDYFISISKKGMISKDLALIKGTID